MLTPHGHDPRRIRTLRALALGKGQDVAPVLTEDEIEARRLEVPFRIEEICKEYFNFDLQWFHLEVLDHMFRGGRKVVNLPTDHGKSTVSCFLFPILSLMMDPNETHIICGVNINDSKRRVQAIQRELETNAPLIRDYPWIAKPKEKNARSWSATQLNVVGKVVNKPNPSVLAAAIGSGDLRGRRGKLIMDDVEGEDARWSPMKRQQLYDFVKLEAIRCYEDVRESPRPLLIALGTPFDVDSIYFKLESEEWETVRYPVYLSEEKITHATGSEQTKYTYLWPAKEAKVDYMRRTLTRQQFAVGFMMDPTGGDSSVMSFKQLADMAVNADVKADQYRTFISLDPSSGSTNRRADYTGISVCKISWASGDELPKLEVLEAHRFTQGLFEQVHFCAHLASEYHCPVVYEANSQQGGTYANAFMHLHPEVQLIRHYTTANTKFDEKMGLTVVKTLVRRSRLKVREAILETEGVQSLLTEVRDLGSSGAHDHIAASIWFVVRYAYEQVRYWNGPKLVNAYANGGYTSNYFGGRPMAANQGGGFGSYRFVSEADRLIQEEREREVRRMAGQRGGS